jgi:hypothetical protein
VKTHRSVSLPAPTSLSGCDDYSNGEKLSSRNTHSHSKMRGTNRKKEPILPKGNFISGALRQMKIVFLQHEDGNATSFAIRETAASSAE